MLPFNNNDGTGPLRLQIKSAEPTTILLLNILLLAISNLLIYSNHFDLQQNKDQIS